MRRWRIALIGAGPAGLTAALAGRRLGLDVRVYEQAADFRRVGGGIMLHTNGLRVLDALGVLETFHPFMRLTTRAHLLTAEGSVLSSTDLGELNDLKNQTAAVLRYQLQEHLLGAVEAAGVEVAFGHRLSGLTVDNGEARLRFANGEEESADVVIAADGVHSAVREACNLPAQAIAVGEAYLRGVAEAPTPRSDVREIWAADGRRFGICPLVDGRVYFYCSAPLGGWNEVLNGGLSDWIESWANFGPEIVALLRGVSYWNQVNYSELHEVRMQRWHRPPVFLIGDAAHAMTPNLGQGANSAMVDALVLMRLLGERGEGDLADVARRHEDVRLSYVTKVQSTASLLGRMAGIRWGMGRWSRDALIRLSNRIPPLRRSFLRTLTGYNAAESGYLDRLPASAISG